MSNIITLLSPEGLPKVADENESSQINGQFFDPSGDAITGAILSLTLSLQEEQTAVYINNRQNEDIFNKNGGRVDPNPAGALLTIKLSPDDNVIVSAGCGETESHIATCKWTWQDLEGDTRTGTQKWRLAVAPALVACPPAGWL